MGVSPDLTLREALAELLFARWPEGTREGNLTFKSHAHVLKKFAEHIGDVRCNDLTPDLTASYVQRFLDQRRSLGDSARSIINYRKLLSSNFSWLIRRRLLPFRANPASASMVGCERPIVRCGRPLSDTEAQQLLDATRSSEIYLSILLCLAGGLRPRGASRVKREHLDLDSKSLMVFEKGRERVIPLSDWFVSEVKTWLQTHEWHIYCADEVWKRLQKLRKAHGLPSHVQLQACRRTFLRKLFEAGVAPQLAANLAGNSLEIIQRHYVSLETLNARSVVNVLDFGASGKVLPPESKRHSEDKNESEDDRET